MAAWLLIIALLSVTGTIVESANDKTGCDEMPNNDTCLQENCNQQPCSILCGQVSPYERCNQECNGSTCDSMVCTSSINSCLQDCHGGAVCKSFNCESNQCFQKCTGGDCSMMTCAKDASHCEQSSGKEMICHSGFCQQTCRSGQCNMTCSSSVKRCDQDCVGGGCFYQCAAEKCAFQCTGGNCTKIIPTTNGTGTGFQMGTSLILGLVLAFVSLM